MPTSRAKDLADFIAKQSTAHDEILETGAMQLPAGTTGERPTAVAGMIRYNSTTALSEYYDGTQWKSIDSPPIVSSISPSTETDANANIVITGSNFQSGATVKFVGNDGTEYSSPSVTFDSVSQITATTPATALSVANEPYDVVVTNTSGLSGTLADALDAGGVPAFNTSAGTVTIYDSQRGTAFDAGATDPDGDTITYSVSSGSLPAGASLNTSTGSITGMSAVGTDTASTFTISAATASDTSTRTWTLNIKAPAISSYTSTGSGTYSVPSGVTAVNVLVVAGGGGGGGRAGGGGGAGGLIYRPAFPVTPGGSVSYTVGGGGPGGGGSGGKGTNGSNSVFGTLTAQGGGGGGDASDSPTPDAPSLSEGRDGGSGGGHGYGQVTGAGLTGAGTQPQQPGDSGTYGFGNPGGYGSGHPQAAGGNGNDYNTGGGGGAGGTGGQGDASNSGDGGVGRQYSISGSAVYYAGGGGGGSHQPHGSNSSGGNGGGGNGAINAQNGSQGTANRGGGAGGAGSQGGPGGSGGTGGSGIVIVSY